MAEQFVARFVVVPVPQRVFRFREETAEAVKWAPRGRVQQRTVEQIVDVPQFAEETVEMVW